MYFMQTPGWPGQTAKEQGLAPRRERPCPKCHQDPITGNKSLRLQIQRAQISSCMHTSIWVDISSSSIFFKILYCFHFWNVVSQIIGGKNFTAKNLPRNVAKKF